MITKQYSAYLFLYSDMRGSLLSALVTTARQLASNHVSTCTDVQVCYIKFVLNTKDGLCLHVMYMLTQVPQALSRQSGSFQHKV